MNNKRAMEIRDVLRSLALIERSYACNKDGDPTLRAGALRRESALLDAANEIGRLREARDQAEAAWQDAAEALVETEAENHRLREALERIQKRAAAQPVHVCGVADFDLDLIAREAAEVLK